MSKRFRTWLIWGIALTLSLTYVSSTIAITQKRYEQFRSWNAPGFCYVSWEDETSKSWERKERALGILYGPLNCVEYDLRGLVTPHAKCSPFFRIAK